MALSTSLLGSMLAAAAAHDASNKGAGMASPPNGGDYAPAGQSAQAASAPPQAAVSGGMMGAMLGGGPAVNPRQYSTPAGQATPTYWSQPPQNGPVGTKSINTPSGSMVLGSSPGNASGGNLGAGSGSSLFGPLTVDYKGAALPSAPNFMAPPASGADNTPIPYKPTTVTPPPDYTEDPRIQDLRDAAKHLYDHAAELDPPKHPGMSLAQALVGIAGAVATQGNPKAQFVANYLPSLGKAIEDKYGDSQQAWQVARQNVLNQAQAMATQADEMQKAGLQRHQIDTGYYGKTAVAGMNAQGKLDVEALKQNGQAVRSALIRASRDNPLIAKLITAESPSARVQGYEILRKNGLNNWTDAQIEEASKEETAKQFLERQQGANQTAQAGMRDAQTDTINATRQATVDLLRAKVGLTDSQADKVAEFVKEMPEAQQIAIGKAQMAADNIASLGNFRQGMLYLGGQRVDAQRAAQADALLRVGMQVTGKQMNEDAIQLGKLQAQFNFATNEAQKAIISQQAQNVANRIATAQTAMGEYKEAVNKVAPSNVTVPAGTARAVQIPQPTGVRPVNPSAIGAGIPGGGTMGGNGFTVTKMGPAFDDARDGGGVSPVPKGGASNAVTHANAMKVKPLPNGITPDMMIASARNQIRQGKDSAAVLKRLAEYGIQVK